MNATDEGSGGEAIDWHAVPLEQRHRDAMLDLILAWGELDTALGMLLSCVLNMPLVEGAETVGKMPATSKFRKIFEMLRDSPNGEDAARKVKSHKRSYEKHSLIRKPIAHSKCLGAKSTDKDFILFAAFEKHGENGLAVDAVPVQEIYRATLWGREMTKVAMAIVENIHPI